MMFGPCGGVHADGRCEAADRECPFLSEPPTHWPGAYRSASRNDDVRIPGLVADFRVFPGETHMLRDAAAHLGSHVDAALVGDHIADRAESPPTVIAPEIVAAGLPVVATLACRGRSLDSYRAEVARLVNGGIEIILCVTGDHPAALPHVDVRDLEAVAFTTESMENIGAARDAGAVVAVAESPDSPPGNGRVHRLRHKVDAGAQVCFVNHCADPASLVDFVDAARAEGIEIPFVAAVPAVTDVTSSEALEHLPGMHLPAQLEPESAGGGAAASDVSSLGRRLRHSGRFAGLNLSGRAHAGTLDRRVAAMARLADAIRSEAPA